jgi:hypothetical protein
MTTLTVEGLSDAFSKVFAQVVEERFAAIPVTACLVWDIALTPDAAVQHIAQMLGLQRVLGADSLRSSLPRGKPLLAQRGTRGGLHRALESLGHAVGFEVQLGRVRCDGSLFAAGEPHRCGGDSHWAVYRVEVTATSELTTDEVGAIWRTVAYFGRRSGRCVLVIRDAYGLRVFRDDSTTSAPTNELSPATFDDYFDETFSVPYELRHTYDSTFDTTFN